MSNGSSEHHAALNDIRKAPVHDLLQTAKDIVREKAEDSHVFDETAEARVQKLDLDSIRVGRVIGRGGFCVVREIDKIKRSDKRSDVSMSTRSVSTAGTSQASLLAVLRRRFRKRRGIARGNSKRSLGAGLDVDSEESPVHIDIDKNADNNLSIANQVTFENLDLLAGRKSRGKYVLKQVAPDLQNDDKITYLKGIVDLAMEAKFLAALDHPNLIRLTGESVDGPFQNGYFLVIEKLQDTLSKRIKIWMDTVRQSQGITGVIPGSKRRMEEMERDRLIAAYDIARAGGYLHSKDIIFRDLKPDNIGYDTKGVLKIFDFGLAKELKNKDKTEDGLYNLTGLTGALRYMAPEVGLGKPYTITADVYSWSMILWYMLALEPPLGLYSEKMIAERVFNKNYRPTVFKRWSDSIKDVMQAAWHQDQAMRPSFEHVSDVVKTELVKVNSSSSLPPPSKRGHEGLDGIAE